MIDPNVLKLRIEEGLPGADVQVEEYSGGGDHFTVKVISELFEGLTSIKRHQKIYSLFKEEMETGEVHAMALKTETPEESGTQQ